MNRAPMNLAQQAAVSVLNSQVAGQRQPELAAQINRLERALGEASSCVDALENRLSNVLRPPGPLSPEPESAAAPQSGYASTLYSHTEHIDRIVARLSDLLNRLEA